MKRYPKTLSVLVAEAASGLSANHPTFIMADLIRWLQERYPGVAFNQGAVRSHIIQHTVNGHPSHDDYADHGRRWKERPLFMRVGRGVFRVFSKKKDREAYAREVERDRANFGERDRSPARRSESLQNLKNPAAMIADLSGKEREAIDRTLAFMTYNPSIGRVLEKRGVGKFQNFAVSRLIPPLSKCGSRNAFDRHMVGAITALLKLFKTHGGQPVSFGQAQKPITVFLKVYCDWANRPSGAAAKRLRPWLHVPLDSILMKWLRKNLRADFEARIAPVYREHRIRPSQLDLLHMNRDMYLAWQRWFREIHPSRPVLLDVIWAVERGNDRKLRAHSA